MKKTNRNKTNRNKTNRNKIETKKIMVTGLLAACLLSVAGCGTKSEEIAVEKTTEVTVETVVEGASSEPPSEKAGETVQSESRELGAPIEEMVAEFETTYHSLQGTIVDYDSYKDHKSEIDGFYGEMVSQTEEAFDGLTNASIDYFRYIFTEYAEDDKALRRAIEDYFDDVYSGILDDYFDDVYSGVLDDMYDDYYSGILSDAYDQVAYQEWSDASTEAYQMWSDTSTEVYTLWSEERACCYRMWSEASSQYYQGNKDIDAVMESITLAKDEQEENVKNQEEETNDQEETDDTEETNDKEITDGKKDDGKDGETAANTSSGEGVDPELKAALDAYEDFFDNYVEFMQKYQSAGPEDMAGMMGEYSEYLLQYTDTMQKLQKIQSDELSTQDMAYYIEVTSRIEQKLLTITE